MTALLVPLALVLLVHAYGEYGLYPGRGGWFAELLGPAGLRGFRVQWMRYHHRTAFRCPNAWRPRIVEDPIPVPSWPRCVRLEWGKLDVFLYLGTS